MRQVVQEIAEELSEIQDGKSSAAQAKWAHVGTQAKGETAARPYFRPPLSQAPPPQWGKRKLKNRGLDGEDESQLRGVHVPPAMQLLRLLPVQRWSWMCTKGWGIGQNGSRNISLADRGC